MSFLTDEERTELRAQHKRERDKRICDRIKAVLLSDKGWSPKQIAEALLISDDAVRLHIEDYKSSQKLKPAGGGSVEKLSLAQSEKLENHLQNHTYLYIRDIIAYVKSTFGISYTVPGMQSWLKRHHFSYKKPSLVPGKANEQAQKEWLVEYETLKQNLPEDETICFMDGVHPTHNVQPAYGWIKTGVRKEIPGNSGRSRLNLSGAIDIVSHKIVIAKDETLNALSIICFLKKVEAAYPRKKKIHIFCDNARYYKNKDVRHYLESSKIELHFLPPYSPNLNPIERLWKWMKERTIYNSYYASFEEFESAVFGFFNALSLADAQSYLGQIFRQRIRDKFRSINAPITDF